MNETGPLVSLFLPPGLPGAQGSNATGGATHVPQQNTPLLPSGTLLTGTIFGMDRQGNPVLRTENGDFVLKSEFHLRTGSEVTIRLESVGSGTRARILSVDGQPPGKTPHPLPGQDTIVNRSLTSPGGIAQASSADPSLRALLVSRAPALPEFLRSLPPELQTPAGRVQQGAQVILRLIASQPVSPTPMMPTLTNSAAPPPAIPPSAPAMSPASTPATSTPAPVTTPGATVPPTSVANTSHVPSAHTATLLATPASSATPPALTLPSASLSPAAPPTQATSSTTAIPSPAPQSVSTPLNPFYAAYARQSTATHSASAPMTPGPSPVIPNPASPASSFPGQIIATVLGTEGSGEMVLQTPLGTLKLPASAISADAHMPVGSKLTLELLAIENPSSARLNPLLAAAVTPRPLLALPELATSWPALQDFMHALSATDPAAAQRFIQQILPKPGSTMASDLLFFLSILRGGDMSRWLDQKNIDRLEQAGRGDIFARLTADFSSLRAAFGDTGSPAWQAFFFPIYHDGELRQARLYVKKYKEGGPRGQQQRDKEDTRFILEIELSHLGDLQFDGFIKKKEGLTLFDLVIRSLLALDGHHQDEIMKIFLESSQLTGFKGGLQFQHVPTFPVNPLDELLSGDHEGGGIIA